MIYPVGARSVQLAPTFRVSWCSGVTQDSVSACVLALEETLLLLSDCRPISRAATSVHECLARAYSSPAIRTFADGTDLWMHGTGSRVLQTAAKNAKCARICGHMGHQCICIPPEWWTGYQLAVGQDQSLHGQCSQHAQHLSAHSAF